MPILNPNSTDYQHPWEPNLSDIHLVMQYNSAGEPVLRTHVDGINLTTGDVIVDAVRIWDGTHYLGLELPNNDGEAGQYSIPVENYNYVFNGTSWDRMRGNTTDGILAKITNFPAFPTTIDVGNFPAFPTSIAVTQSTTPWKVNIADSAGNNNDANHPVYATIQDGGGSITVDGSVSATVTGSVSITGEVEIKNDLNNPIPISKDTAVNSSSNRIYVSQETDIVLADSNYELNLARGLVDGQYIEMKNGYAPSMSTGSATVWGLDVLYPWSAWTGTGSRLWVGSDNAADVGQTVYIDGLDSTFAKINETVTLNGTTYVQTTKTFYRVNRMYQLTGATNTGNISARVTSSSGTQVYYMLAGNARGKNGIFTIPAGYTAYILYGDCSSYKNGSGNVSGQVDMYTRTYTGVTMPFMNQFAAVVANGQYRNEFNVPLRVPEKTDIDVRFNPSGNATTVTVNWEMILIPN